MIDIERILTLYLEDRSCYCKLMRIIGAIGVYLFFLFTQICCTIMNENKNSIKFRKMINYSFVKISDSVHEINVNKA